MKTLLVAAATAGALAIPAGAAEARHRYGYHPYSQVQREIRECNWELRTADSRREYRRELRECRREIRRAERRAHRYAPRRPYVIQYGYGWRF